MTREQIKKMAAMDARLDQLNEINTILHAKDVVINIRSSAVPRTSYIIDIQDKGELLHGGDDAAVDFLAKLQAVTKEAIQALNKEIAAL